MVRQPHLTSKEFSFNVQLNTSPGSNHASESFAKLENIRGLWRGIPPVIPALPENIRYEGMTTTYTTP